MGQKIGAWLNVFYIFVFWSSMIHGDLTCWNEERSFLKENDEKKEMTNPKLVLRT